MLLVFVALIVAAVTTWFKCDERTVFSEQFEENLCLTIKRSSCGNEGYASLKVTYHCGMAIGTFMEDSIEIPLQPGERLSFGSASINGGSLKCVYDKNGAGIVFMFHQPSNDLWHSGRTKGWNGSNVSLWEERFLLLRAQVGDIPYLSLPRL